MNDKFKILIVLVLALALVGILFFAFNKDATTDVSLATTGSTSSSTSTSTNSSSSSSSSTSTTTQVVNGVIYKKVDEFTERDLTNTYDSSSAVNYTVSDNNDITINQEGVYVISGTAKDITIIVAADDAAKVQIVLNGVSITNTSMPAIYVKSADKVFITTVKESLLKVTGTFKQDGTTNLDGVVFSKDDVTFNGTAKLTIESTENGLVGKDDLKITGGTYVITAVSKCIEANDSIRIADGTLTLKAGTDCLHSENDDDNSLGYIYICGGTFSLNSGDDAIHAITVCQIDDGTFDITAAEGIEATYVQLNGGTITISASDDGINAAKKSTTYTPTVEINKGTITITMGQGDTDGIDSNGNVTINGGTLNITGQSTIDYDGTATYNGGTMILNGTQTTTIPNQMMGGGIPGSQMGGGKQRNNF